MNVREVIKRRMKQLKVTAYRLSREAQPREVSSVTIYDFLRGDSDMTSEKLGHVLDILGLEIRPRLDTTPEGIRGKSSVGKRGSAGRGATKRIKRP